MASKQQNQNFVTLFENLPNELLIKILSYLPAADAVIAFFNLNYRFQCLILEFCRSFDLTSISKSQFDIIFQNHNTNRWYSLKLSDDENTPGQVKYFFEKYSFINNFCQLQSLSIVKMAHSNQYPVLSQLSYLPNLISLEIESICGNYIPEFDLPTLKKLTFSSCTNISWLKNFSQIETIEYTIIRCRSSYTPFIWPKTLKHLKIIFTGSRHCPLIQQSLTNLSQLIDLEIYQKERDDLSPNGQIWEEIISSSLPLLKNFKFYFQINYPDHRLDQIKEIVASFSTPFYVSEKKWFVRCDVSAPRDVIARDAEDGTYYIHVQHVVFYTIPFPFQTFTIFKNSKTMGSNSSKNSLDYSNIKTLLFESCIAPDQNFHRSHIINLITKSPFESLDWVHVFTKLRHLTLEDGTVLSVENFNILLDNTPYLCSLTVKKSMLKVLTDNWTDIRACNHLSRKIRSLTFHSNEDPSQCFHKNELEKILPIFSSKCQHLSIGTHSRNEAIDYILRKMSQLNSLHVRIQARNSSPVTIEWLQQRHMGFNHSNCFITNVREDHYFWLG